MKDSLMIENQSPTTGKFLENQEMLDWNVEQEIILFQQILKLKPIGPSRQWKIMCIRKRLQNLIPQCVITSEIIWDKLITMFDLEAIEELHKDNEEEIEPEDFELNSTTVYFEDTQLLQPPSPLIPMESNDLSPSIALIPENAERRGPSVDVIPKESGDQILRVSSKKEQEGQSPPGALISKEPQESNGLINISRRKSMAPLAEPRLTRRKSKVLETAKQGDVSLELSKSECSLEDIDIKGEQMNEVCQTESPPRKTKKSANAKQNKGKKSSENSTESGENTVKEDIKDELVTDEHVDHRDENEPEMPILEPAGLEVTEKDGVKETDQLSPASSTLKTAKKNMKKGKVYKQGKTRRI